MGGKGGGFFGVIIIVSSRLLAAGGKETQQHHGSCGQRDQFFHGVFLLRFGVNEMLCSYYTL